MQKVFYGGFFYKNHPSSLLRRPLSFLNFELKNGQQEIEK
jgi:hypothetical protein